MEACEEKASCEEQGDSEQHLAAQASPARQHGAPDEERDNEDEKAANLVSLSSHFVVGKEVVVSGDVGDASELALAKASVLVFGGKADIFAPDADEERDDEDEEAVSPVSWSSHFLEGMEEGQAQVAREAHRVRRRPWQWVAGKAHRAGQRPWRYARHARQGKPKEEGRHSSENDEEYEEDSDDDEEWWHKCIGILVFANLLVHLGVSKNGRLANIMVWIEILAVCLAVLGAVGIVCLAIFGAIWLWRNSTGFGKAVNARTGTRRASGMHAEMADKGK